MKYSEFFKSKTRPDGSTFMVAHGAPSELEELIKLIHFSIFEGCLPNDWVFEIISQAFDDLEETPFDDITLECDVYYHDLWKWFGNGFAHGFCNEAMEEGLCEGLKDIYAIIGWGQYLAKQRVYAAVDEFMNTREDGQ